MSKSKRGAPWCAVCGIKPRFEGDLSYTGQCPDCGEAALIYNIRGLVDPTSVPYKCHGIALACSRPGRPPKTTPPQSWKPSNEIRIARYSL
jgi:predicted RNA-binding Zn-ribbon protein involved in translation (DUF1610 family)